MEEIDWYKKRNDRTNRIDGVALNSSEAQIGVIIEEGLHYTNQLMAKITLNIMARWCGNISIQVDDSICTLYGKEGMKLKDLLAVTVNETDPYCNLRFEKVDVDKFDLILVVGKPVKELEKDYYWIDADGWISSFGFGEFCGVKGGKKSKIVDLIGAAYSSTAINSLMFEDFLGLRKREVFERYISLYDFSQHNQPEELANPSIGISCLDMGKCLQVGAGAVGSSFDYLISLIPLQGNLTIVDYDYVDISNTSSSLAFTATDAHNQIKKIVRCKEILKETDFFKVDPHEGDYNSYQKSAEEQDFPDLILCLANERNIWSSIQYNDPPIVLSATTSPNWGINFGRHIPFTERCLVCTFGIEEYQTTPVCSEIVVVEDSGEEEKLGSLPFLSTMSAVFVIAEIFKLNLAPKYPVTSNFIQLSMKDLPNSKVLDLQVPKGKGCKVCSSQNRDTYYSGYMESKFFQNT
ncbi:ThiF family adenylyltransferase [Flagellimonas beolgyonensis]|uniref:ThiF family adenylyltransferase n=1 Tax=Flagellimonas beolgyonensis TaxID=864064 RepID=UPI000F8F0898|nr:ThiF family adenylyltransferase [Allomuricauda beolgyonensis]